MTQKEICTEEYYIASIDLLAGKSLILSDDEDTHLNHIRNIYTSWKRINKNDGYFSSLTVKFFSDNVVIAQKCSSTTTADDLLEFVSYMSEHLLRNGYKPRGAVCKGKLYIDDIFVWGKGLVTAYTMESKDAIYPRILLDSDVVSAASDHLKDFMIFKDKDGKECLHYMKGFGVSSKGYLERISPCIKQNLTEIEEINTKLKTTEDTTEKESLTKVLSKLQWLDTYLNDCKNYWESQLSKAQK